jgi:hypothetical protein
MAFPVPRATQRNPAVGRKRQTFLWKETTMQTKDLYRATIRVANTTDMSGTGTADEINRAACKHEKERSLVRITVCPLLGP